MAVLLHARLNSDDLPIASAQYSRFTLTTIDINQEIKRQVCKPRYMDKT